MDMLDVNGSTAALKREIVQIKASVEATEHKLRVAGYARVSSDSDDQLNSFAAQMTYYARLAEQNTDWEFVDIYADEGISGVSTEKRDDFSRLLQDCKDGKIDRIITKSLSRFSRNSADSIQLTRELKSMGVSVLFEKERIDTAKITSENLLTLYSTLAQEESISISNNCKKGARMRMSRGEYVSSNAAYGYRLVDNDLQIYEPEAVVVRRVFEEYSNGKGAQEIAKGLNADVIPQKQGNLKWTAYSIVTLLRNERYIGDMRLQKYYNEDTLPYRKQVNRGELPQYYVKNTHPSIINRIQFKLVNILLDERRLHINTENIHHALRGKIRCRHCNTVYRYKNVRDKTYWVCRAHDKASEACPAEWIREGDVYAAFVRMYNKLQKNHKYILETYLSDLERLRELEQSGNAELHIINKQIVELTEQSHALTGLMSSGILDSALFISQTDELNRKVTGLKQAKSRMLEGSKCDHFIEKTEELIAALKKGPTHLLTMDEAIFEEIVDKILASDTESLDFVLSNGLILNERL